jgi:hypothetical protein
MGHIKVRYHLGETKQKFTEWCIKNVTIISMHLFRLKKWYSRVHCFCLEKRCSQTVYESTFSSDRSNTNRSTISIQDRSIERESRSCNLSLEKRFYKNTRSCCVYYTVTHAINSQKCSTGYNTLPGSMNSLCTKV